MADKITLLEAIEAMNHNDDSQFDPVTKQPALEYLSAIMGEEITREMVNEVAGVGHLQKPELAEVDKTGADSETQIASGPVVEVVEEPKLDVDAANKELAALNAKAAAAQIVLDKARNDMHRINAARDKITESLARHNSHDLATVNAKIFAANDKAAAERHANTQAFLKATGGVIPSKFASKLDERGALKRNVKRAVARAQQSA